MYHRLILVCLLSVCAAPIFADYYVGVEANQAITAERTNQSYTDGYATPIIPIINELKMKEADKPTNLGLVAGYVFHTGKLMSSWLPKFELGLALSQSLATDYSGDVIEPDVSPSEATGKFSFKQSQLSYQLRTKAVFKSIKGFSPYIGLMLGYGLNKITNYRIIPNDSGTQEANYVDKNTNTFIYGMSLGSIYQFSQHYRIGLAVNYQNLGTFKLGSAKIANDPAGRETSEPKFPQSNVGVALSFNYLV